jgi:hypothetical protein
MPKLYPVIVDTNTSVQYFGQHNLPCQVTATFQRGYATHQVYLTRCLTLHYETPVIYRPRDEEHITALIESDLRDCPEADRDNLRRVFGDILDTMSCAKGGYWAMAQRLVARACVFRKPHSQERVTNGAFAFHATPDFICLTGVASDEEWKRQTGEIEPRFFRFRTLNEVRQDTLFTPEFLDEIPASDDDYLVVLVPYGRDELSNHEIVSLPTRLRNQLKLMLTTFPGDAGNIEVAEAITATSAHLAA